MSSLSPKAPCCIVKKHDPPFHSHCQDRRHKHNSSHMSIHCNQMNRYRPLTQLPLPTRQTYTINQIATTSQNFVSLPITPTQNILLSTALVKIYDRFGKSIFARALLDSCSQHCLMSKGFSEKFRFRESPSYLSVQGIGPSQSVSTKVVTALVEPRCSAVSDFSEEIQFHVLPELTSAVDPSRWNFSPSIILAEPHFHEPGSIDLIIGAEYFMDLLGEERQKLTSRGPTLQNTAFGWIVSGRIPDSSFSEPHSLTHITEHSSNRRNQNKWVNHRHNTAYRTNKDNQPSATAEEN